MDLARVLSKLRRELDDLDAAILSLERLQEGTRRGRPLELLAEVRNGAKATAPKAGAGHPAPTGGID